MNRNCLINKIVK